MYNRGIMNCKTFQKILFVIDKIELKYFEFNNLVTNFWLIKEFLERGQEVFITTIDKLSLSSAKACCRCAKSFLKGDNIYFEERFDFQHRLPFFSKL